MRRYATICLRLEGTPEDIKTFLDGGIYKVLEGSPIASYSYTGYDGRSQTVINANWRESNALNEVLAEEQDCIDAYVDYITRIAAGCGLDSKTLLLPLFSYKIEKLHVFFSCVGRRMIENGIMPDHLDVIFDAAIIARRNLINDIRRKKGLCPILFKDWRTGK